MWLTKAVQQDNLDKWRMCPVTTVTICTVNTLFTATLEFLFQLQNNVKTVISFDFQELCTVRTCLIIIKKAVLCYKLLILALIYIFDCLSRLWTCSHSKWQCIYGCLFAWPNINYVINNWWGCIFSTSNSLFTTCVYSLQLQEIFCPAFHLITAQHLPIRDFFCHKPEPNAAFMA